MDYQATEGTLNDMVLRTSNRLYRWGQRMRSVEGTTMIGNMKIDGGCIVDMDTNDTAYIESGNSVEITNLNSTENSYFSGYLVG